MPINEARGRTRSTLTREQKRQAELAIYGLQETTVVQNQQQQFSGDDIERMRAILAQHDAQQSRTGIKEFDLNNPPKDAYQHQAFPTVVYHHGKRTARKAHNAEELEAALEAGWSETAYPAEVEEPELDDEGAAEVAEINAQLNRKRKAAKKSAE